MLGDRIVVNIDDLRNTPRGGRLCENTNYVPRKISRMMRAARALRLTGRTTKKLREDWMLQTISRSGASLVFVHFLDYAVQFSQVWQRIGIPVVVHCHGYDVHWDVRHMVKQTPLHPASYPDRVQALSDNVWFIANSSFTRQQLLRLNINPAKIFLKRFGVPVSAEPRCFSGSDRPRVLFLGRLVDFKGPFETTRAFAQLVAEHPNARLDIAGDGELASELDNLIMELGIASSVNRHGAVNADRGRALRRQATVFTAHNQTGAISRQTEAFGVSLLEAMGQGLPVVTGNSGGIPDFIRHQENGLLFKPGDIDAHTGMLDDLLSSCQRRNSLGAAAWETVKNNYQPEHELTDMLRIFETAIGRGGCPTLSQSARQAA
jgi:glycosyltransferase involved in cell wall biosynthesis